MTGALPPFAADQMEPYIITFNSKPDSAIELERLVRIAIICFNIRDFYHETASGQQLLSQSVVLEEEECECTVDVHAVHGDEESNGVVNTQWMCVIPSYDYHYL